MLLAQRTTFVANIDASPPRREVRNGRAYLVRPISSIVPGVLNGSRGALRYPAKQVARNVDEWDGMPLLVGHPTGPDGQNISADDSAVWTKQGIGFLRDSTFNGKLRHEGWFDEELTKAADKRFGTDIYQRVVNGEPIEGSTGLYTDNQPAPPNAVAPEDGRSYEYTALNYRPDHYAVLPNGVGACSVRDGCGINVNAFCATGPGGGQDNSCSPYGGGGEEHIPYADVSPEEEHIPYAEPAKPETTPLQSHQQLLNDTFSKLPAAMQRDLRHVRIAGVEGASGRGMGGSSGSSVSVARTLKMSDGDTIALSQSTTRDNLRHELGHALDEQMGGSTNKAFVSALNKDAKNMTAHQKDIYDYFFGQGAGSRVRDKEVFAQTVSVLTGKTGNGTGSTGDFRSPSVTPTKWAAAFPATTAAVRAALTARGYFHKTTKNEANMNEQTKQTIWYRLGQALGITVNEAQSPSANDDSAKCKMCKGTGKIRAGNVKCPDCGGSGKMSGSTKNIIYGDDCEGDDNDDPECRAMFSKVGNAAINQPRHVETGQWLPAGSGTGKGMVHTSAVEGASTGSAASGPDTGEEEDHSEEAAEEIMAAPNDKGVLDDEDETAGMDDRGYPWEDAHSVKNQNRFELVEGRLAFVGNKDFTQVKRKKMASKGQAMKGGGYPIQGVQDLKNAIQAIGRAKNPAATKKHIKKRAKALGASQLIPDHWTANDDETNNRGCPAGQSPPCPRGPGSRRSKIGGARHGIPVPRASGGSTQSGSKAVGNCGPTMQEGDKQPMYNASPKDATTHAAVMSVKAGGDGRKHAIKAVDNANDSPIAAEHHIKAAEAHEVAATKERAKGKNGSDDMADQHDQAAAHHRKAASMHMATGTHNELADNWCNQHGGDTCSGGAAKKAATKKATVKPAGAASTRAGKATTKANKTGKAKDHQKAASAHGLAARLQSQLGNKHNAAYHHSMANEHQTKSQTTHNEDTAMTKEEVIDAIVGNCACQADVEQDKQALNELSNERLVLLYNATAQNDDGDEDDTDNEDDDVENLDDPTAMERAANRSAVNKVRINKGAKAQSGVKGKMGGAGGMKGPHSAGQIGSPTPPQTGNERPPTMEDWLAENGSMEEQEMWNNVQRDYRDKRRMLLNQLVGHVQDKMVVKRLVSNYEKHSNSDLEAMVAAMPKPQPQRRRQEQPPQNFYPPRQGAGVSPSMLAGNTGDRDKGDVLDFTANRESVDEAHKKYRQQA